MNGWADPDDPNAHAERIKLLTRKSRKPLSFRDFSVGLT